MIIVDVCEISGIPVHYYRSEIRLIRNVTDFHLLDNAPP